MRPTWTEYFMNIAQVVATRSNCSRRHVGAIVVHDKRIISTGYNGTPKGYPNCSDGGCDRCNSNSHSGEGLEDCLCIHAEENAIIQAAYHGTSCKDSILYCTLSPCIHCSKTIINAGITQVIYKEEYIIVQPTLDLLDKCGIKCEKYVEL